MRTLFLLFITVPIVEMWLLIEVGARIGALPTIALVFLTAAIGLALLRQQGLNTLFRVNQRMAEGQLPAGEILEGVMLAIGGALLLTPGFITDVFGFACLLPPTRKLMVSAMLRRGVMMAAYGSQGFRETHHPHHRSSHVEGNKNPTPGDTIEGDYRRDD